MLFQEALADRFGKGMSSEMLSNSSKSLDMYDDWWAGEVGKFHE